GEPCWGYLVAIVRCRLNYGEKAVQRARVVVWRCPRPSAGCTALYFTPRTRGGAGRAALARGFPVALFLVVALPAVVLAPVRALRPRCVGALARMCNGTAADAAGGEGRPWAACAASAADGGTALRAAFFRAPLPV